MHDDLSAQAARRARGLMLLVGVAVALGPAGVAGYLGGPLLGLVVFAVVGVLTGGWLLAGAPGFRVTAWPTSPARAAEAEVANINDGIAIARDVRPARPLQLADAAPNVGAVDREGQRHLLVTDGARAALTRDQLEAVCAAQLAIADDPVCRRLEGAVTVVTFGRVLTIAAPLLSGIAIALFLWGGVAVSLALLPAEAAVWLFGGRLRWWSRVAQDAACVRATRHPEALAEALLRLARWDGPQVRVGLLTRTTGAGGSAWAVTLGPRWTSQSSINDRVIDRRTSEMVEDTRLLVRAALVRRVCLEGAPATVDSYDEVRGHVRRAGRAAAQGEVVTIEGQLVGLEGVVSDPAPAPPGEPSDPA